MAFTSNMRGQRSWYRFWSATLRCTLLVAILLAQGGLVDGGAATTAPEPAHEQQVAAVTGYSAPCCDRTGQKTFHDGIGMHGTCAFCVPIPQSFVQDTRRADSEVFMQDFAVTRGRNAAPEPFPPRFIPIS